MRSLGNFRIPFEKSTMYDTDVRVPFYVRGPGVPAGGRIEGMASLMDVGATMLELAGVTAPGQRTTDGRSLVPLMAASGAPPPGWRNGVLIEHLGEVNQWMDACGGWVYNYSCPAKHVPQEFLIDGPQNTFAEWRVVNSTHDFAFTDFRPRGTEPLRANTNWTELYNLRSDPWQGVNIADSTPLEAYRAELWAVADCALEACP